MILLIKLEFSKTKTHRPLKPEISGFLPKFSQFWSRHLLTNGYSFEYTCAYDAYSFQQCGNRRSDLDGDVHACFKNKKSILVYLRYGTSRPVAKFRWSWKFPKDNEN